MPTVLVVEDEVLIRDFVCEELADTGFEVIQVGTADEAIAVLEARQDIHLVFTDIDMPGSMDGIKLAAAVRDRWPPVHIIITTGKARPLVYRPMRCLFRSPISARTLSARCGLSKTWASYAACRCRCGPMDWRTVRASLRLARRLLRMRDIQHSDLSTFSLRRSAHKKRSRRALRAVRAFNVVRIRKHGVALACGWRERSTLSAPMNA
ncbi:response regulator [Tardiphaga sp. 604_B6_N1_1]|uniref:response regulator n=1 Tax=unclassified Tardiphaga TaxID=2631404 RepID=UPI003F227809